MCINNVGRMLLLGLPRKQNGCPVEYITYQMLISSPKWGLQHLQRLIFGLLTMEMLAGPLLGDKDTGKVRNWRVAKSRIVLILILCILILVKSLLYDSSDVVVDTAS